MRYIPVDDPNSVRKIKARQIRRYQNDRRSGPYVSTRGTAAERGMTERTRRTDADTAEATRTSLIRLAYQEAVVNIARREAEAAAVYARFGATPAAAVDVETIGERIATNDGPGTPDHPADGITEGPGGLPITTRPDPYSRFSAIFNPNDDSA